MAHFYGQVLGTGDKPVSRNGTKQSGIVAEVVGRDVDVRVVASNSSGYGDIITATFGKGQHGNGSATGRVQCHRGVDGDAAPVFFVDVGLLLHVAHESWRSAVEDPNVAAIIRRLFLTDGTAIFERTAARLLLEAYAKAEKAGTAVSLEDLDAAWLMAKQELPGEYQLMLHELDEETSDV